MQPIGIYLHIPFCASKCAYCDFYSFPGGENDMDAYADRLCQDLLTWGERLSRPADTLYIGGGTPSLLGGDRVSRLVETARTAFGGALEEITLEANPADDLDETLRRAAAAGVNRLSLGVQSGNENELRALSRRHTNADVVRTVRAARSAGIGNLSLDLMLGIPGQTADSLSGSIEFLCGLEPEHLSAYLLKIEPGTPFAANRPAGLPDADAAAGLYLDCVEALARRGFAQYEISNFAREGKVSRHNLKYWTGKDYLGLGPAAHSMLEGRRFYFSRDLARYMDGGQPVEDGPGGGEEEYTLLRLRLTEGIQFDDYAARFGHPFPTAAREKLVRFAAAGYAELREGGVSLTPKGFLVSNAILAELI